MQYNKEFKLQALELADEIGVKAAARTLSIASMAHWTTWKGSMRRSASGQYSSIQDWIHLAPSPETSCIEALCSFVSCLKNREKTPFPCPS